MKIYLLYENPYDEGDNVFGAFSTIRKAARARKTFAPYSSHKLYIKALEVDELESFYEKASRGYRWYHGNRTRHDWNGKVHYGEWSMVPGDLDGFFNKEEAKVSVLVRSTYVWASVEARSIEEAKEVANKILSEKSEGYLEWLE